VLFKLVFIVLLSRALCHDTVSLFLKLGITNASSIVLELGSEPTLATESITNDGNSHGESVSSNNSTPRTHTNQVDVFEKGQTVEYRQADGTWMSVVSVQGERGCITFIIWHVIIFWL
jgi:hypothetical protein